MTHILKIRQSVTILFMAGLSMQLSAQQHSGQGVVLLPPLSDAVLDGHLKAILMHMDAFSADSSMARIGQAMAYEAAHPDTEARYYLLSYRAEVLYYEGLFNEAMRDLDKCDALARELNDSNLVSSTLNLKGLLHENIQDSRKALPYLYEALANYPKHPKARYPLSELHHIHGNLGSYLTVTGSLDSAEYHLRRSLELALEAGAYRAVAVAWWSKGNLALRQQRAVEAERWWAVRKRSLCKGVARRHCMHSIRRRPTSIDIRRASAW